MRLTDPNMVRVLSQVLAHCAFHTMVSRHASAPDRPWIITVGEMLEKGSWQRHLVVEQTITRGRNAVLAVLGHKQSATCGTRVDTTDIETRIMLDELIAGPEFGIVNALRPPTLARA